VGELPAGAQRSTRLADALELAAKGVYVAPACWPVNGECGCGAGHTGRDVGKAPLTRHGNLDATTNATTITAWWTRWTLANILIDLKRTGLVDLAPDCPDALDEFAERGIPAGAALFSSGGGPGHRHHLLRRPDGCPGRRVCKANEYDIMGDGYAIAPPSVHVSGRPYAWIEPLHEIGFLPDAPPWVVEMLTEHGGDGHRPAGPMGEIIAEGERNATMTSLAGSMRRRSASEGAILAALEAENEARCQPPLEHGELVKIAASVARYAPGPTFVDGNDPEQAAGDAPPTHRRTDVANAERFVRLHGENALYCDPLGGWQLWKRHRWQRDTAGVVVEWAKYTARGIYMEATSAPTKGEAQDLARWAASSENEGRLAAMVSLSQSSRPASPEQFDRNPWLLNVKNGTIDLTNGQLLDPKREDYITKLAPVVYDSGARDPVWDRFISDVTGGDEELARYLQRAFGYSLTGDTREEVLLLVLGPTATGKSTLLESFAAALGDYALKLPFDTFLQRRDFGAPRPDIAHLRGARFVIALEASKGRQLDEAAVKEIVGGDTVTARFLYHDLITFRPVCKLWLGTNFAPQMNNLDTAIWRRVRRVPFEREFGDTIDTTIKAHLRDTPTARSAILAWAVAGCLDWQHDGLGTPAIVASKTAELRAEMNPLREFIESCCIVGRDYSANARDVRRRYEEWAKTSGARPIGNKEWGDQLRGLGTYRDSQRGPDGKTQRLWVGLGIVSDRTES